MEFLTFDHVGGWGKHHRKDSRGTSGLMRWITENDFPSSIQVLCMNCNWSKGMWGYCPHELEGDHEWKLTRFGWVGPNGLVPWLRKGRRNRNRLGARAAIYANFDLDEFFGSAMGRLNRPCACGCGEMLPDYHLDGTPSLSKFKQGHNRRQLPI